MVAHFYLGTKGGNPILPFRPLRSKFEFKLSIIVLNPLPYAPRSTLNNTTQKEDLPIQGGPLDHPVRSRFFRLLSSAFRVLSNDLAVDDLAQSAFRAEQHPFYE